MPDCERVIKELEKICGYTLRPHEFRVLNDALALLKEQETGVSPKEIKMYPNNVWACGNCGHVAVGSAAYKAKYCPECGKKVQWNA